MQDKSIITELLKQPVAYQPTAAKAFDSINLAILWGQLFYWHGKQKDLSGWIYKSEKDIYEETALSRKKQETARKEGIALGVFQCERMGEKGVMHYKLDMIRAEEVILKWFETNEITVPVRSKKEKTPVCDCFDTLFWPEYPRNENKKKAKVKFEAIDHAVHEKIIADVKDRKVRHSSWLEGYIPHATTYLNEERWNDEIRVPKGKGILVRGNAQQKGALAELSK